MTPTQTAALGAGASLDTTFDGAVKTTSKVEDINRDTIVTLAYGRFDHAFLQSVLKRMSEGRDISDVDLGFIRQMEESGLIIHQDGSVKLSNVGSSVHIYMQDSRSLTSKAQALGFNDAHLYNCLRGVENLKASSPTVGHLESIGFISGKELTATGQRALEFLHTLELAKWKRAGKPECAPQI